MQPPRLLHISRTLAPILPTPGFFEAKNKHMQDSGEAKAGSRKASLKADRNGPKANMSSFKAR